MEFSRDLFGEPIPQEPPPLGMPPLSDDPFLLPEERVQVCFSGGRTSRYLVDHLIARNPEAMRDPDRVRVVFTNTGREVEETLEFVAACERSWGLTVHMIERDFTTKEGFREVGFQGLAREGEPFEALIGKRRYLPNQQQRFCTTELKVRAAKNFLWKGLGWKRWVALTGIRYDEPQRLIGKFGAPTKERWTNAWPLYSGRVTKADVIAWGEAQSFDLRLPSHNGKTALGNCDGCFLKSEAVVASLARDYPERHAWWERMEDRVNGLTKGDAGHFSKRYTRREMRELVERHGDWIFNDEAFLCQASDGDCTG